MKINYPIEAYCSLIGFLSSLIFSGLYSYFRRNNSDNRIEFFPTIYFLIISSLSTLITALILQTFFVRRSTIIITKSGNESSTTTTTKKRWPIFSISWRAGLLGSVFAFGLNLSNLDDNNLRPFGFYLCILSFFHWSEYFATAVSSWETLSLDSFLLNHSFEYWAAAGCSWFEFLVEYYYFPSLKSFPLIMWMGVILCIVGEVFRKLAMLTAGRNFTHLIQYQKRSNHQLVTHGVYSLFRHPSYVGWFWWSIGTQVTTCNPICTILYALISWRFFNDRIHQEEITLINFFGEQYVDYQNRVPTGLPGITGFRPYC